MGDGMNLSALAGAMMGGFIATLLLVMLFQALWRKLGASPGASAALAAVTSVATAVTIYTVSTGRFGLALIAYAPGAAFWGLVFWLYKRKAGGDK